WLDTIYIAVILLQGTYTPLVYAHDGRTQKMVIEITTDENEARKIYHHLKESLSQAYFEVQLFPLLNFDV
ncbi:MAG: hypothetical protein KZQ70_11855, partial [gamma proteobacterium symbiont of Lucinoma myriamae]|nr:hypothetical protein [gamma proteobacterium symbiont of Lucinoma myriamae]MCU7819202.1 hypothetical protein [gamma proteobacterium symbiont of Lucinoma myriamae]MCU7833121.1 hypothetical protein [gamma proteobacterium symbiont of Lucinoma myriamae]